MSHRIVLREVVVDVPTDRLEAATRFWAGALGAQSEVVEDYPEFVALRDPAARCGVGLQDIGTDTARFHVDIETDDVAAEVTREVG